MSRFDLTILDDIDLWMRWLKLFGGRCSCKFESQYRVRVCEHCAERIREMDVEWH